MTEAHVCEQLAQTRYIKAERPGVELVGDFLIASHKHYTIMPVHNTNTRMRA